MNNKKHKKTCAHCGKVYYAKNIRGTYCSDNCRVKANRKFPVTVSQNPPVELPEEIESKKVEQQINNKQSELNNYIKEAERDKQCYETRIKYMKKKEELLQRKELLTKQHGRYISGIEFTRSIIPAIPNIAGKVFGGLLCYQLESALGNPVKLQDNSLAIKRIDQYIEEIDNATKSLRFHLFFQDYYDSEKNRMNNELNILKSRQKALEVIIHKAKNTKDISQLKDQEGFITAKAVSHAKFPDRIKLEGNIGEFLGPIERSRCAISLSGVPGSGKTYFSFDLMKAFACSRYSVGYFSIEEGISDLTREKIVLYGLQNEENCKFREFATLNDIQKFATVFDVIVIDSWGKLKTDIDEFDKLRVNFPNTFFIVIFQLTSAKTTRGGPKADYDASINISTFFENNERYAINTKNRYNKLSAKYLIDQRKIIE